MKKKMFKFTEIDNWKPDGRLLNTLYDHKEQVHSLIPINDENFISCSRNEAFVWKVGYKIEDIDTNRINSLSLPNNDKCCIFTTKKILTKSKESIGLFDLESEKGFYTFSTSFFHKQDNILSVVENYNEDNLIIFSTDTGSLVTKDIRTKADGLTFNLSIQRGAATALTFSNASKFCFKQISFYRYARRFY